MKRDRFVARLFVEGLVMVLGILLAFQLESWREARTRFQLETAQLIAIRDDVVENQSRLATVLAQQGMVVDAGLLFVAIHDGTAASPPPDSVVLLIDTAESWFRLEPVTGAYDAMVNSGDVTRIQSQELQRVLATLTADLTSDFEDQVESMSLLAEMRRQAMGHGLLFLMSDLRSLPPTLVRVESEAVAALVANRSYAHLLYRRTQMEVLRLEWFKRLADQLADALTLLEAELDGRGAI